MLHAQDPPPTTINPGVEDVSLDGAEKGATARHAEHHIDPATERSLVRKLDWYDGMGEALGLQRRECVC